MRNLSIKQWTLLPAMIVIAAAVLFPRPSTAQEDLEKPPPIPPEGSYEEVPIPPKVPQEQIEPTVTIREEDERMIEEYRLDGQIYMVKVTPRCGIPYYYIDTDGDGKLELDMDQSALNPVQPVHWKVLEWD